MKKKEGKIGVGLGFGNHGSQANSDSASDNVQSLGENDFESQDDYGGEEGDYAPNE